MVLPTNTVGQSWITGSAGAVPVYLMLPSPVILTYTSVMPNPYFGCGISMDYVPVVVGNFSPNSASFTKTSAGNGLLQWMWYSTIRPGVVDSIIYDYFRGARAYIQNINLQYGAISAMTGSRWGVMINNTPGSSSILSLESSNVTASIDYNQFTEQYIGDMWSVPSGSGGGIHFRDKLRDGSEVIVRLLGGYSTSGEASMWFPTDSPRYLLANNILTDYGYFTLNSSSFYGAGITNFDYDSGIHMTDANTVSVYGLGQRFWIRSGSLKIRGDIHLPSSTSLDDIRNLFITSGSITLLSGSISSSRLLLLQGFSSSMWLGGTSSVATMNFSPFVTMLSPNTTPLGTGWGSPGADTFDLNTMGIAGDMYIIPSQSFGAWIRANDTWYMMYSSSNDPIITITGGIY